MLLMAAALAWAAPSAAGCGGLPRGMVGSPAVLRSAEVSRPGPRVAFARVMSSPFPGISGASNSPPHLGLHLTTVRRRCNCRAPAIVLAPTGGLLRLNDRRMTKPDAPARPVP